MSKKWEELRKLVGIEEKFYVNSYAQDWEYPFYVGEKLWKVIEFFAYDGVSFSYTASTGEWVMHAASETIRGLDYTLKGAIINFLMELWPTLSEDKKECLKKIIEEQIVCSRF